MSPQCRLSLFFEISVEIRFIKSSMFGIFGRRLMQLSFNFRESNAIFTVLSFFTVITAGEIKVFSGTSSSFSMCPDFINFLISFSTASCRWSGIGRAFCCTGFMSGFRLYFYFCIFHRNVFSSDQFLVFLCSFVF